MPRPADEHGGGAVTDLQQRAAAFLVSEGCRDRWLDGDDPVCQVHGFLWPHGRQFCNGVDEKAFQILAELAEAPAPASPRALRLVALWSRRELLRALVFVFISKICSFGHKRSKNRWPFSKCREALSPRRAKSPFMNWHTTGAATWCASGHGTISG